MYMLQIDKPSYRDLSILRLMAGWID